MTKWYLSNVTQKFKTMSLKNIVSELGQKSLSLRVPLTIEFELSLVGMVTFSSLVTMMLIQNFTNMIDKIKSIVVGVVLAGKTLSKLHTLRHWNQ